MERCSRDRSNTDEQKRCLLKHYLMLLKEYGKLAEQLPRGYLYKLAGEKAFYKEKTAGKYIREMLRDSQAIREAEMLIEEELT